MTFTGNEDHSITLNEASQLTGNYRSEAGTGAILGGFFGKTTIQNILDQDGCVGIRYYYGLKDDGTQVLVLVGVDASEDDITDGELAEWSNPCPPFCGTSNPLNSQVE